jgi:hypothetical protein
MDDKYFESYRPVLDIPGNRLCELYRWVRHKLARNEIDLDDEIPDPTSSMTFTVQEILDEFDRRSREFWEEAMKRETEKRLK